MSQPKRTPEKQDSSDAGRRDLAKIHIAKKQIGLEEETYRDMLQNVAGSAVASATGLIINFKP